MNCWFIGHSSLQLQQCLYVSVCMCVRTIDSKKDESAPKTVKRCYLPTAAGVIHPLTYRSLLHGNIFRLSVFFSICPCFVNSALSSQGELITIIWRSVPIYSSSMCASTSHRQTCLPSQRCRLALIRPSGLPATVSRPPANTAKA